MTLPTDQTLDLNDEVVPALPDDMVFTVLAAINGMLQAGHGTGKNVEEATDALVTLFDDVSEHELRREAEAKLKALREEAKFKALTELCDLREEIRRK